jgi:hypothetical protein
MLAEIKKYITATILTLIISGILFAPAMVSATNTNVYANINQELTPIRDIYGQGSNNPNSLSSTIAEIILIVLGFLGIVFIVLTIYAGLMWMTSAGNEDKITTAKKTLVAAVIGLTIVLGSYAITRFVLDEVTDAVGITG